LNSPFGPACRQTGLGVKYFPVTIFDFLISLLLFIAAINRRQNKLWVYQKAPCIDTLYYWCSDFSLLVCNTAAKRVKGKAGVNYVTKSWFFLLY